MKGSADTVFPFSGGSKFDRYIYHQNGGVLTGKTTFYVTMPDTNKTYIVFGIISYNYSETRHSSTGMLFRYDGNEQKAYYLTETLTEIPPYNNVIGKYLFNLPQYIYGITEVDLYFVY